MTAKRQKSKRRPSPRRKLRKTPNAPRTGRHGGLLRTGNPGNKGGGNISAEWREHLAGILSKAERRAYMKRCASGRLGWKAFAWAIGYCSDHVRGKPTQPISGDSDNPLEGKFIVEYVHTRR